MTEFNIKNRTVFVGDNLLFLRGINSSSVDCIYLDPPSNRRPDHAESHSSEEAEAQPWQIFPQKERQQHLLDIAADGAELSQWLDGVKAIDQDEEERNYRYLVFMSVRLLECHRILKPSGSLFTHCDDLMSHFLKITLDCIFDEPNFRNEIIWQKIKRIRKKSGNENYLNQMNDRILWYTKTGSYTFHNQYQERPSGDVWSEITHGKSSEQLSFPTQKPLELMQRLISLVTNKGDIVIDPFAGSATTAEAAENLGRQWAIADISEKTYPIAQQRLASAELIRTDTAPPESQVDRTSEDEKFVYIFEDATQPGWFKVGVTKNVARRLEALRTGRPDRESLQRVHDVRTKRYRELEKHIHHIFENRHEWVKTELQAILDAFRSFLASNHDSSDTGSSND